MLIKKFSPDLIFRWENHFYEGQNLFFDLILKSRNDQYLTSAHQPVFQDFSRYPWVCCLGFKDLLNFTWKTIKFHNCFYANENFLGFLERNKTKRMIVCTYQLKHSRALKPTLDSLKAVWNLNFCANNNSFKIGMTSY